MLLTTVLLATGSLAAAFVIDTAYTKLKQLVGEAATCVPTECALAGE